MHVAGRRYARTYRDSIELMHLAAVIEELPGVERAAALMGTPINRDALAKAGLLFSGASDAAPDDLIVAVRAEDEGAAAAALEHAARALSSRAAPTTADASGVAADATLAPRTMAEAAAAAPDATLAVISVPGPYAAAEAEKAIRVGLDAFIFSDNVALDEEIALKTRAAARGRLVMGPDCRTAILGGIPLGFANNLRRGPIGLAGASGTGLQQVSSLVHRLGSGVSHVVGVGARDLDEAVGGLMMLQAIQRLGADPDTRVIGLVSRPPSAAVAERVLAAAAGAGKPVVACFLGARRSDAGPVLAADTLEDAAVLAVALAAEDPAAAELVARERLAPAVEPLLEALGRARPGARLVRGLYSGGTLAAESRLILGEELGEVADLHDDPGSIEGHAVLHLGADGFTRGRPHPMIDPRTRAEWLARCLADPSVGVILLDVVIGHGAHDDPAASIVAALDGAAAIVIASVCGTDADAQGLALQELSLAQAGVVLAPSNAAAARLAAAAVRALAGEPPALRAHRAGRASWPALSPPSTGPRLRPPPAAVNVGLPSFTRAPASAGIKVTHIDWRPAAGGDPETARRIARLADHAARIDEGNAEVLRRILAARPQLVAIRPAREALGLEGQRLLHAGPPIAWRAMCGPMRGAAIGAVLHEGWAADPDAAAALLDGGAITLEPNHLAGAVSPMAGLISPSMPVWVVTDETSGARASSSLNEGLGKVLRFGAYSPEVLTRLAWMRDVLGPALGAALERSGPIDVKTLIAQSLQMGDEAHNRCTAATGLLLGKLAGPLARAGAADAIDFLSGNAHFALNVSMAAAKATLDGAAGVPASSVVTAMARNGVSFGVRLAGTGDRWFTAPCERPDALYFPGYGPADANPDLGDCAITECVGLGGFAMAAAPAIARFVGGRAADALAATRQMAAITIGENPDFALPALDFRGAPTGIDARRVVETAIAPLINTGVAHREAGVGQIGAGIVRAPFGCFVDALAALEESLATP